MNLSFRKAGGKLDTRAPYSLAGSPYLETNIGFVSSDILCCQNIHDASALMHAGF